MVRVKKRRDRLATTVLAFLVPTTIIGLISTFSSSPHSSVQYVESARHDGRHLLQVFGYDSTIHSEQNDQPLNCTPRSIEQFPHDIMSEETRKNGGIVVHFLVCIYIFAALAIVCDDYFVASLEKLSTILGIQSDVAGATFMAAGSSAPELFTSIIGVFFAKSDVGLGTIVGSAVFNLLIIIAVVALFAGQVIYLLWWPLMRDSCVYILSIVALALVIYDNQVSWYEAASLLVLYMLYITLMAFNGRVGNYLVHRLDRMNISCLSSHNKSEKLTYSDIVETSPLISRQNPAIKYNKAAVNETLKTSQENQQAKDPLAEKPILDQENLVQSGIFERSHGTALTSSQDQIIIHAKPEEEEFESPLKVPDSLYMKLLWVILLPIKIIFILTIPDCRRPGCWQKSWPVTFLLSICWLAVLSYIMVWMVTVIGDTFGIPDAVLGLTLLAAGTSIPDAMASLFVAKDGFGDMAVSNSIGSNIFDILICLGFPWLLQTAIISPGDVVPINSNGIVYTTVILLCTVMFLVASMMIYKWKLDKKIGILLIVVYVIVITIACLFETNLFGNINLPPC